MERLSKRITKSLETLGFPLVLQHVEVFNASAIPDISFCERFRVADGCSCDGSSSECRADSTMKCPGVKNSFHSLRTQRGFEFTSASILVIAVISSSYELSCKLMDPLGRVLTPASQRPPKWGASWGYELPRNAAHSNVIGDKTCYFVFELEESKSP